MYAKMNFNGIFDINIKAITKNKAIAAVFRSSINTIENIRIVNEISFTRGSQLWSGVFRSTYLSICRYRIFIFFVFVLVKKIHQ